VKSKEEVRVQHEVDEVYYVGEMKEILKKLVGNSKLLTLKGRNTDSGNVHEEANFEGIKEFNIDNKTLFPELTECRVIKTPEEIEVLRYVVRMSRFFFPQIFFHFSHSRSFFICLFFLLQ
jgi:Xaa-Pro dipeptidase